jgi:hypothetical protein
MRTIFLTSCALLLLLQSCFLFDIKPKEKDQLPPETQTGANTFGCLVDGKVFLPKRGGFGSPEHFRCDYQFVDGHFVFQLVGTRYGNDAVNSVGVYYTSTTLIKEGKYSFSTQSTPDYAFGQHSDGSFTTYRLHKTDGITYTGELWIKKIDTINGIISGTFWFNALDDYGSGSKVEIREGRFDARF